MTRRTVLAITKRSAQFCGTQSLLWASGIDLVDASNMRAARRVIHSLALRGVIVCLHSWSERERDTIASELAAKHPEVTVIVRCPGCTDCDEAIQRPGTLSDTQPFSGLIPAANAAEP